MYVLSTISFLNQKYKQRQKVFPLPAAGEFVRKTKGKVLFII